MTSVLAPAREQHHQLRAELRSERLFREAVPLLPPLVARPLAEFVDHLALIRQAHTLDAKQAAYESAYPVYQEARRLVEQRLRWLSEYGAGLWPSLRATSPAAQELALRLARVGQMASASLAALVTAQCVLDDAIAHAEDQVAA
jgi:hypothetical protein